MVNYLIFVVAFAACFLFLLISSVLSYWRLRSFKGPRIAAWTDWWFVNASCSGKQHLIWSDLIHEYGQMCRVGTNLLITDDEDFMRKMNSVRSEYTRSDWYKALKMDGNFDNVISETDHTGHMNLRNKFANGYAGTGNPDFEAGVDRVLWDVINLINSKYLSHGADLKPFDHSAVMQYFTLDVVMSLSLGKPFGFVSQDKDIFDYVQTMWENFPVMNFMLAYPPVVKFLSLPAVQKMTVPSVKDRTGLGKIKAVAFDIVRERMQEKQAIKETRKDMMDSFIKNGLNEQQIADNVLVQLLAGSDTTTTILRMSFVYYLSNGEVYQRLRAECDEAAKEIPDSEIISYQRAGQITYLDACIKEALRHSPAATGFLPRVVPKGGDYYNGKYLPPGTVIGSALWNMSRRNKVYGEDYEVFRPERWLDSTPEQLAKMEKTQELLFSSGRHRCLGERLAKIELYKMTFELIRRFNMTSLNPMKPIDKSVNYGLWMQRGMWLRVESRDEVKEKV